MKTHNLKSHLTTTLALLIFGTGILRAENLIQNGAFELETSLESIPTMKKYTADGSFVSKNFEFDFDPQAWVANWVINGDMAPAKISFGDRGEGGRYLHVETSGDSHVFYYPTLPTNSSYTCSFLAKGASNEKSPKITPVLYFYDENGWLSAKKLPSFGLTDDWATHSFLVSPEEAPPDATNFRLAFEFNGICDLDDVVVEASK